MRWSALLGSALLLGMACQSALAEEQRPKQLQGVTVKEQLGKQLKLDIPFRDEQGRHVKLADYFRDGKPVLLTLNYYRCKMLCSLQLTAVMKGMRELSWTPGKEYRVVTISINPKEGPKLAQQKRQTYLKALGKGDVDWHFLVGKKDNIDQVARGVGFVYRYIPKQDQYAHPAAIYFLSPDGKVSRYLYGLEYPGRQLKFALVEASEGRVGSPVDRIILSCFHYDASVGRYGPFAFGIMRLAGVVTLVLLGLTLGLYWRHERRKS